GCGRWTGESFLAWGTPSGKGHGDKTPRGLRGLSFPNSVWECPVRNAVSRQPPRNSVSRTNVPKQSLGTRAQTAKPRGCGPGVPGHLVTLSRCHLVIVLLAAFSPEATPSGKASRRHGARNCDAPFAHAGGNGTMRESVLDRPGPWTTYH